MGARLRHRRAVPNLHRPSHRGLLARGVWPVGKASTDAIVIPAVRDAHGLKGAMQLAVALDCPIVVLCSYDSHAVDVVAIAAAVGAHAVAVDATKVAALSRLETTRILDGTQFRRSADTPVKRNLGLAIARMVGWRRILLLDDDVTGVVSEEVSAAAGLLGEYDIVGMKNTGFHDNSVVCHANRDTGGTQGTFIGAGAMLINSCRTQSFFPDIYNEDWLYLLDEDGLAKSAEYGTFYQAIFDPYAEPERAASQELGDCLAEGIYALLDHGRPPIAADRYFWAEFLFQRQAFIEEILHRLSRSRRRDIPKAAMEESLAAARVSLAAIKPSLCASYIKAWRRDRHDWSDWIEALPTSITIDEALHNLGQKFEVNQPANSGRTEFESAWSAVTS